MAFTTYMITFFIILLIIPCKFPRSSAQTWIKAGYWYSGYQLEVSEINSALFTHLICGFASLNSSTYQVSVASSDERQLSHFTNTVKRKNPHIVTLLSVFGIAENGLVLSSMINQSSYRKAFIDSSIITARSYGFHGLDLYVSSSIADPKMANMAIFLSEWRAAIEEDARNSTYFQLIITMTGHFSPYADITTVPIGSMTSNLDWTHLMAFENSDIPGYLNFTGAYAALYNPGSNASTDYSVNAWINAGFPSMKLVLGLTFYGLAWTLVNPNDNAIGAPAKGPGITEDGWISYRDIKAFMKRNRVVPKYNKTYVTNYCRNESLWISFNDVEAVKTKVEYARQKNLLGYFAWQVSYDDNWFLSQVAAQEDGKDHENRRRMLLMNLIPIVIAITIFVLVSTILWYVRKRHEGSMDKGKESQPIPRANMSCTGNNKDPNLLEFHFIDIEAATNNFSFENKLGEGGYGPVYNGKFKNGQEIAVKRLSKTSKQGYEEFKNEVMFTEKLQHVNLVKVLGYCVEREEQMLIYEYMPNKSLDYYIYDPIKRLVLDWEKRIQIIEGVVQGLLYLQEYSRFITIHRDLKVGNILLDSKMKPKISDFEMARIFQKDELEANTSKIVGTFGYIPPEYAQRGIYSTKSDVYSFGVILLQIISGKLNNYSHGQHGNLNLLEYAYELWKEGKGMEFMDPSVDDTNSSCKLVRCMQVALPCVQENPADRPSMPEVSSMLKFETATVNAPKCPTSSLLGSKDEAGVQDFLLYQQTGSVDDVTITQVLAR